MAVEDNLKQTHLQSNHSFYHLQVSCPGAYKHLHLRGHGRCASSAQSPREECKRFMMDGYTLLLFLKGG